MSVINVSNLTFAYDGSYDAIFENVSFCIDTDWKLGFTGRNGRGKTTFLKLLQKKLDYSGTISSSVEFEYFPYEVEDKEQLTVFAADSVCRNYQQWQLIRELNLLHVSEDVLYRPFNTLSGGEQTKVLLAAMFLNENSFLLIDEPTNHLDEEARKIVGDYLNTKKGFILVSHDRKLLDSCIDHVLAINKTNIEVCKGNFSTWLENKEAQDNFERNQNEKLKKDIKRLATAAKRTSEWSDKAESKKIGFDPTKVEKSISRRSYEGAKAKKMMSRSQQIQSRRQTAIEEKSKLLRNVESADDLKITPLPFHSSRIAVFNKIAIVYGERIVCENVSFQINQGDKIALTGKNGCGKSSLLKLLCGEDIGHKGEIIKSDSLKISYVPQDASYLRGSLSDYAEENSIDESTFKAILRKLDFSREQFDKDMSDFSAGQKKKVLIAGSLCTPAHLYVWDEPLNYIDIFARMQIEQLLARFSPTLLFVEHDVQFRENISAKVIEI